MSVGSAVSVLGVVTPEAILENTPNPTLTRIRGSIHIVSTATGAANARALIVMGIMVVDGRALTAGIGSLELPFVDIGSDWLWWDARVVDMATAPGQNEDLALGLRHDIVVDNKAMRKVGLNQAVVFVTSNIAQNSSHTVQVSGALRVLYKR